MANSDYYLKGINICQILICLYFITFNSNETAYQIVEDHRKWEEPGFLNVIIYHWMLVI